VTDAKRGRGSVVVVRLSTEEREALLACAQPLGINLSDLLRQSARAVGGLGPVLCEDDHAAINRLCETVNAASGHLAAAVRVLRHDAQAAGDEPVMASVDALAGALASLGAMYVSLLAAGQLQVGIGQQGGDRRSAA
jgi:hypothetical protein